MAHRGHDPHQAAGFGRLRRALGDPAFPVALLLVAGLLAAWPFVRSQPGGFAATSVYLFALWLAFVAALAGISWARRPPRESASSHRG